MRRSDPPDPRTPLIPRSQFSINEDAKHSRNDDDNQSPVGSYCQHNSPRCVNLGRRLGITVRSGIPGGTYAAIEIYYYASLVWSSMGCNPTRYRVQGIRLPSRHLMDQSPRAGAGPTVAEGGGGSHSTVASRERPYSSNCRSIRTSGIPVIHARCPASP